MIPFIEMPNPFLHRVAYGLCRGFLVFYVSDLQQQTVGWAQHQIFVLHPEPRVGVVEIFLGMNCTGCKGEMCTVS